jgi:hypothetical protein
MPQIVVGFKEEDHTEGGEPCGWVFLDLVVSSEDAGAFADIETEPLGKLPWWYTRDQAKAIANENGWFFDDV